MEKKILIIQTAFIGDAILTLPMIQKIHDNEHDVLIDVISIPSTQDIFQASPFINEVIVLDKKDKHKSFLSMIKFSKEIKERNYDKIISPHRSFRSSLLVLLSKVKNTIGFDNASMSFIYKEKIHYENELHEVQRNMSLLGKNNLIQNWKILPELKVPFEQSQKIDNYIRQFNNNKLAAIAPGSVWKTKMYPEEHFIKVIEYLRDEDFYVVLIGGERDIEISKQIKEKFPEGVFSASGEFTLIESIELLKSCEFILCNDSSPTHMAMCADIPAVTIYCSTTPSFGFYPYNNNSTFVSFDQLKCKPCGIHGHQKCPIKTFDCGHELKPNIVIEKIKEIIS